MACIGRMTTVNLVLHVSSTNNQGIYGKIAKHMPIDAITTMCSIGAQWSHVKSEYLFVNTGGDVQIHLQSGDYVKIWLTYISQ